MKMIAVLAMSVVGGIIFPAASFLHARNREWAGGQFRQDAQPKKASFTNPVLELEIKYESGVTTIAFSPDSKILAIGADDYTIQLCDARTGQVERRLNEPDRIIKENVIAGGQVTLWEIPSGKLLRTIIVNREISAYTNSVVFTPDGKRLVTGMTRYGRGESAGKHISKGEISEWDA